MDLNRGDVVLLEIRFHQTEGTKLRPAVVILDTGDDDFVAAPITSRPRVTEHDLTLAEWEAAGLNVSSIARIHKLAVLSKTSVRRVIGTVTANDLALLNAMLCRAYCRSSK